MSRSEEEHREVLLTTGLDNDRTTHVPTSRDVSRDSTVHPVSRTRVGVVGPQDQD